MSGSGLNSRNTSIGRMRGSPDAAARPGMGLHRPCSTPLSKEVIGGTTRSPSHSDDLRSVADDSRLARVPRTVCFVDGRAVFVGRGS